MSGCLKLSLAYGPTHLSYHYLPNVCYAAHILCQFLQAPREEYMNATRRVLRYIKGSPDCGIMIHAHRDLQLSAYCDSNWGACPLTRRSLTGYLVTLGGSPIS